MPNVGTSIALLIEPMSGNIFSAGDTAAASLSIEIQQIYPGPENLLLISCSPRSGIPGRNTQSTKHHVASREKNHIPVPHNLITPLLNPSRQKRRANRPRKHIPNFLTKSKYSKCHQRSLQLFADLHPHPPCMEQNPYAKNPNSSVNTTSGARPCTRPHEVKDATVANSVEITTRMFSPILSERMLKVHCPTPVHRTLKREVLHPAVYSDRWK